MNQEPITWRNIKQTWVVFALLVPTVLGVAAFSYIPAIEAIRHAFYKWDGQYVEEFTGLDNLRQILGRLDIWVPLLVGMVSSGLSALVGGTRSRRLLRIVGLLSLAWTAAVIIKDARPMAGDGAFRTAMRPVFYLLGGTIVAWVVAARRPAGGWGALARFLTFFLPITAGMTYVISVTKSGDQLLWMSFRLIFVLLVANLFTMWPSIFTAVCIHRLKSDRAQYIYRVLFVVPMIIPAMVGLLIWKFFYDPSVGVLNKILISSGLDHVLIWLDTWVLHLGVFTDPFRPAWLGDPSLIIPALIFWGFPWVGVVGVLIYLAGLQNIGGDVYEAAEIDGITSWGKFWRIELPLIMTQVRLNLILMVIGTFQAYGFQLILLGPSGGPENKGLTPGLYMFFQAFTETNYGYACALGLILFFIILVLTIVNQKYVRVQK
ncbi:MAG: sugar ABC transporter permease [Lentisphaerae bacterium]|nr:sugar ABC transporter permease [Lentisphaerota bacterium]